MTLTRATRAAPRDDLRDRPRDEWHQWKVPVARADVGGHPIEIVESRTSRWLFDRGRRRFLRLPRSVELDVSVLAMAWQPYEQVSLDGHGGGVVVTLADGGRVRLEVSGAPTSAR